MRVNGFNKFRPWYAGLKQQGGSSFSPLDLFNAGANGRLSDTGVTAKRLYIRRGDSAGRIAIGYIQNNGSASEYEFLADTDGFLRMLRGLGGETDYRTYIKPTLSGSFLALSTTNAYTTTIGDTASFTINGTGFYLRHLADTRGGIWNVAVDGVEVGAVSTYSASVGVKETLAASGLSDGEHSVVLTFAGDDPENAPSATARGWIRWDYLDGGEFSESCAKVIGAESEICSASAPVIIPAPVVEFAINCSPTGEALSPSWIPYHSGGPNAARDISLEISVNGTAVATDVADIFGMTQASSIKIAQSFTGYNSNDALGDFPLCTVTVEHIFSPNGILEILNRIDWLRDTDITAGYVSMLPASMSEVDTCLTSDGDKFAVATPVSQELTGLTPAPENVMFVDSVSGHGVAIKTSVSAATDTGNWPGVSPPAFVNERTDGTAKAYWVCANSRTVGSGDVFAVTNRYAIVAGATFPAGFAP